MQRTISVTEESLTYADAEDAYGRLRNQFPDEDETTLKAYLGKLDSENATFPNSDALKSNIEAKPLVFKNDTYRIKQIIPKQDKVFIVEREAQTFAIKQVMDVSRYQKEASLMESVTGHDNVIRIIDKDDARRLILMEYVAQGNLVTLMKALVENKYEHTAAKAKRLVKGILAGVKYIHERGVFEGDLDAKNIFIGGTLDEPIAKVADFGEGGQIVGNPDSRPSDLFAIVSPLVQIVTGNAITGWGALLNKNNLADEYQEPRLGFINTIEAFGQAVLKWKKSPDLQADQDSALQQLQLLENHAWLSP